MADFNTLIEMMAAIPDEDAAIAHFTQVRWANGAFCPYCASNRVYHFSDKRTHKCGNCRHRFSIKVGTIFEDSKVPLRKWLMAICILTSHKKDVASTQLAKDVGVTQKTAWFMLHRLRAAVTPSFKASPDGEVEVDETFVVGEAKNKQADGRTGIRGSGGKLSSLGKFRVWLQAEYLEVGKFTDYVRRRENKGEIPLPMAQLTIAALVPPRSEGPA